MIVTELRLLVFILVIFLLTTPIIIVDAFAGRCYLCSQNTLNECAGSVQPDSPLYTSTLQYYTEPCNGQCVLFRNENSSTIRGCSWTYGHMISKSTGWHELTPGIQAYFCDSYLCNNGTIEQPETEVIRAGTIDEEFIQSSKQTLSPQQLFIIGGNTPSVTHTDQHLPPINNTPRQLRQCYSCTARSTGCGEFLDPHYVSKYIRPCISSCIIFRNPNDHNLITRDCATTWPHVHAKSGLHKLLGSDAFFCQESLCNGISFDFIMGIFHNQLPAVIKFPSVHTDEDLSVTTTPPITSTTITVTLPISTTINTDDDSVVWEDPELDFVIAEPTTTTTTIPIASTSVPFSTDILESTDVFYESSTIPLQPIEHFDFIDKIPASSTIVGGMAVAQQDSQFNWWDLDEASFLPLTESNKPLLPTTTATNNYTLIPSTTILTHIEDDEWALFNTTSIPSVTQFEHLSDSNFEGDINMNDYFLLPNLLTTPTSNLINNNTPPFVPYYFTDYKTKDELFDLIQPLSTIAMPPFSWMLHLANKNKNKTQNQQNFINKNFTTTISTIKNKNINNKKKRKLESKSSINHNFDYFYEHCNKKQCQNGGRLNSDCLCICLPAFNGKNCEIVHCNQEPAHICNSVLEHECKSDYVRYLCPKFCRMNICSSNILS